MLNFIALFWCLRWSTAAVFLSYDSNYVCFVLWYVNKNYSVYCFNRFVLCKVQFLTWQCIAFTTFVFPNRLTAGALCSPPVLESTTMSSRSCFVATLPNDFVLTCGIKARQWRCVRTYSHRQSDVNKWTIFSPKIHCSLAKLLAQSGVKNLHYIFRSVS